MLPALILATLCWNADPPLDLETLRRVVEGLQTDFEDVEFMYEGGFRDVMNDGKDGPFEKKFQGTMAYRSDGSAATDLYLRPRDPNKSLMRRIDCLTSKFALSTLSFRPDGGLQKTQAQTAYGGIAAFDREGSPVRIYRLPILLYLLRDTEGYRTLNKWKYTCDGWEDVGGHRCLKVRFTAEYAPEGIPVVEFRFWIDLERSGMVLKYEYIYEGEVWARVEDVVLEAFPLKGGRNYWFPVRGVDRFFLVGNEPGQTKFNVLKTPVFEEEWAIVDGAPRFNQKLPDERFQVDYVKTARTALQAARAEVDANLRRPSRPPQALVDESIARANQQRTLLEASAPSRDWLTVTTVGGSTLGAVGVIALGGAWLLRRRA